MHSKTTGCITENLMSKYVKKFLNKICIFYLTRAYNGVIIFA